MQQSPDDLLRELGIDLPPPKGPKVEGRKPSQWVGGGKTFIFGGYLAKVGRYECMTCERVHDELVGIFSEELMPANGTRVLTQLSRGAQWPAAGDHRYEVMEHKVPYCVHCIKELGFSREVSAPRAFALMKGEGL